MFLILVRSAFKMAGRKSNKIVVSIHIVLHQLTSEYKMRKAKTGLTEMGCMTEVSLRSATTHPPWVLRTRYPRAGGQQQLMVGDLPRDGRL